MQLISKYFYTERVYNDSTSNPPKLRWRYRNSYSDDLVNGQRKLDYEFSDSSFGDTYDDSEASSQISSKEACDGAKTTRGSKRIFDRTAMTMAEPGGGSSRPAPLICQQWRRCCALLELSPIEKPLGNSLICQERNPVLHTEEETDPLGDPFAFGGPVEEIHHSSAPNKPPGTHNRGHRRYHHRRMRHPQDLSNSEL